MSPRAQQELQQARIQLQAAEAELEELEQQIRSFETLVDTRLGALLDQLGVLNAEVEALNEALLEIREKGLFGEQRIRYLGASPRPGHPASGDGLPPMGVPLREAAPKAPDAPTIPPELRLPDIKELYRKLARRYHPDLARGEAERARLNEQMAEVNQAYSMGDLSTLMGLAGMSVPFGMGLSQPQVRSSRPDSMQAELEQVQHKLSEVRKQIARLSSLPSVQLSLELKLAKRQGRDLLAEMATDLELRLRRKEAERDYLKAQIQAAERD